MNAKRQKKSLQFPPVNQTVENVLPCLDFQNRNESNQRKQEPQMAKKGNNFEERQGQ